MPAARMPETCQRPEVLLRSCWVPALASLGKVLPTALSLLIEPSASPMHNHNLQAITNLGCPALDYETRRHSKRMDHSPSNPISLLCTVLADSQDRLAIWACSAETAGADTRSMIAYARVISLKPPRMIKVLFRPFCRPKTTGFLRQERRVPVSTSAF